MKIKWRLKELFQMNETRKKQQVDAVPDFALDPLVIKDIVEIIGQNREESEEKVKATH
jgi:hypothetical protein